MVKRSQLMFTVPIRQSMAKLGPNQHSTRNCYGMISEKLVINLKAIEGQVEEVSLKIPFRDKNRSRQRTLPKEQKLLLKAGQNGKKITKVYKALKGVKTCRCSNDFRGNLLKQFKSYHQKVIKNPD